MTKIGDITHVNDTMQSDYSYQLIAPKGGLNAAPNNVRHCYNGHMTRFI